MKQSPLILFDGICNLCNSAVTFVLRHEAGEIFLFASLQSETAQKLLKKYHLTNQQPDSFILVIDDKVYTKSTAALKIAARLHWPWRCLYFFIIVPNFIRDAVYDVVARNRYKWFGQNENCMVPAPRLQARFLL